MSRPDLHFLLLRIAQLLCCSSLIPVVAWQQEVTVPSFSVSPPSLVEFSNSIGARIPCSASGHPNPKVTWRVADGSSVKLIPGLREVDLDGTLTFPPFRAEHFRQDIHGSTYNCVVRSTAGTMVSNDVKVKAIVLQPYDAYVYDEFTVLGNTAVMRCSIPNFIFDYVTVDSWIEDSSVLISHHTAVPDSKYTLTPDGELYIRNVTQSDSRKYFKCRTTNRLTGEMKTSVTAGKLFVADPQGNVSPKIVFTKKSVISRIGEKAFIPCVAQGNPTPTIIWTKHNSNILSSLVEAKNSQLLDFHSILDVERSDEGRYICTASNIAGSITSETELIVTVSLKVKIHPPYVTAKIGQNVTVMCQVSGFPITTISWLKDGHPVSIEGVEIIRNTTLHIHSMTTEHAGIYQCFVKNGVDTSFGTTVIKLGDVPPSIVFAFEEQTLQLNETVTLQCIFAGNPSPRTKWWLDNDLIESNQRFSHTESIREDGYVISHMTIKELRVEDGGVYKCYAFNKAGSTEHSSRSNIYGKLGARPRAEVTAVSGQATMLSCPVYGYPISRITWEKGEVTLPNSIQETIIEYGRLAITKVRRSRNGGLYTCTASDSDGNSVNAEVHLKVIVPPKIVPFAFQDDEFFSGMRAQIICAVSQGDLPLKFHWLKDGHPITSTVGVVTRSYDSHANSLIIESVSSNHTGNYSCFISNDAAAVSYTAQLLVYVPPKWELEPADVIARSGEDVYLHCKASGLPSPSVAWMWTKDINGLNKQQLTSDNEVSIYSNGTVKLMRIKKSREGNYFCIASNEVGDPLSKAAYVSVLAPPLTIAKRITVTGEKGRNLMLDCSATGNLPMSFLWSIANTGINPAKDPRFILKEFTSHAESSAISQLVIKWLARKDSTIYKCQVQNTYGKDHMEFQVTVQEPPEAPSILSASAEGNRSMVLTWTSRFDGNNKITEYVLQYKKNTDKWKVTAFNITVKGEENSTIVTELSPATKYTFRLAAKNSIGMGEFSQECEGITNEDVPSGRPQNVEVESTDQHTLRVTWKPPPKSHWNGAIRGYDIGYKIEGSSEPFKFTSLEVPEDYTEDLIYQITNLKMFSHYSVAVKAYNAKGTGPVSDAVTAMTSEDVPSKSPPEIRCSALSSKSVYVFWEPPSNDSVNGILRGYKIHYKPTTEWYESSSQIRIVALPKVTLQGLEVNTNYTIQVQAFTKAGDGVKSFPVFCKTLEDVPDAPRDIKVLPSSAESVVVAWKPPKNANQIYKYSVYYTPISEGEEFRTVIQQSRDTTLVNKQVNEDENNHLSNWNSRALEVKGLKKNKKYAFWVTASTVIGEGPGTKVMAQTVADNTVPAKSVSFSSIINTHWKRDVKMPCMAVGVPPPQRKWTIGEKPLHFEERKTLLSDGTLSLKQVASEDSGNYTCAVYNEFGKDEVKYFLNVQVPPAAPFLDVISKNQTAVQLQWKPGPNGGDNLRGYVIYYRPESDPWESKELDPEHNLYILDRLACSTKYQLYLQAFNAVGMGAPCDVITISTEGTDIPHPSKESLIREGSTFATIRLEAWPTTGCPIDQFQVEYKPLRGRDWTIVGETIKATQRKLVIPGLTPATWYTLRLTAITSGGHDTVEHNFATHTTLGGTIPPPEIWIEKIPDPVYVFYLDPYIFIPSVALLIVIIIATFVVCVNVRRKNSNMGSLSDSASTLHTWARGCHSVAAQYSTLQRGDGKQIIPYAISQFPPCLVQCPAPAFFEQADPVLVQAWASQTLHRRPKHPGYRTRLPRNSLKRTNSDGALPALQESILVFSNSPGFALAKEKLRPDAEYDKPPAGI